MTYLDLQNKYLDVQSIHRLKSIYRFWIIINLHLKTISKSNFETKNRDLQQCVKFKIGKKMFYSRF